MEFWKKHTKCRIILMAALFIAGISLSVFGWGMTGKMTGLGIMRYWNYLFINWHCGFNNCLCRKEERK